MIEEAEAAAGELRRLVGGAQLCYWPCGVCAARMAALPRACCEEALLHAHAGRGRGREREREDAAEAAFAVGGRHCMDLKGWGLPVCTHWRIQQPAGARSSLEGWVPGSIN